MASYGVVEPDDEFLKIYDTFTDGFIYICNRFHGRSPEWRSEYLDKNMDGSSSLCYTIDVTLQAPYNEGNDDPKKKFSHDTYVDSNKVDKFCKLLIDYACWMHQVLLVHKKVVIFCKNGRSRSPCVVLAFLLLRGMTRDDAVDWLQLASSTQRPRIAGRSANFPNFGKLYKNQYFLF